MFSSFFFHLLKVKLLQQSPLPSQICFVQSLLPDTPPPSSPTFLPSQSCDVQQLLFSSPQALLPRPLCPSAIPELKANKNMYINNKACSSPIAPTKMCTSITCHHHHHLSLNCEGRWGTTDDSEISFLHFSLFSTALWDLVNSMPVHSLMLSSHLFLCLPCLLLPFTVPCKTVFARPDQQETCPYHCSLRLFTIVRRSSCGPIACWIFERISSLVTWFLYQMRSILQ